MVYNGICAYIQINNYIHEQVTTYIHTGMKVVIASFGWKDFVWIQYSLVKRREGER